jgi:hypothetical protein
MYDREGCDARLLLALSCDDLHAVIEMFSTS